MSGLEQRGHRAAGGLETGLGVLPTARLGTPHRMILN